MRGEIFANLVFQANDALTVEGGITAEYSQIKVDSVNSQKKNFSFIKPRISSTYKFNGQTQLSVELARSVGQLNFGDFATSNEAFDGITNTGNSDLMPDQTTELAATYDWSISERGSVKVKMFYQWRKDILEQVVIGEDVSGNLAYGLGNAGSAKFWGIDTDINLPLDFLLSDSLLEISHSYQGSDFYDPIINEDRNINNYLPNSLELNFRQDFIESKFAWGLDYIASTSKTNYRVNEVQTLDQAKRFGFFIESSQFFGVKANLTVFNTSEQMRSRFFYQDNRNGLFNGRQQAQRKKRPVVVVKFSGSF
jgi:outer membrane receptor protein involved in Fe transport